MYATELDPKFKAIFVDVVHVYGVFVFLFNLVICTIIIADNDSRATTYRFYLAALQVLIVFKASSMFMDLIIDSYLPIYQINCMVVYSESVLAEHIYLVAIYMTGVFIFGEMLTCYFHCVLYRRCLVLRRGSRFCLFGRRRFALFLGLQVYMWSMCAVFAVSANVFMRTPKKDIPLSLAWVVEKPSYIVVRATTALAGTAVHVLGWGFGLFLTIVWMVVDLQRELKSGMIHASRTTRRIQRKALTALKLQGIIPGVFYLMPMLDLFAISGYGLITGTEAAASNQRGKWQIVVRL